MERGHAYWISLNRERAKGEVLIQLRAASYDEATWRATIARLASGAVQASQQEQAL